MQTPLEVEELIDNFCPVSVILTAQLLWFLQSLYGECTNMFVENLVRHVLNVILTKQ